MTLDSIGKPISALGLSLVLLGPIACALGEDAEKSTPTDPPKPSLVGSMVGASRDDSEKPVLRRIKENAKVQKLGCFLGLSEPQTTEVKTMYRVVASPMTMQPKAALAYSQRNAPAPSAIVSNGKPIPGASAVVEKRAMPVIATSAAKPTTDPSPAGAAGKHALAAEKANVVKSTQAAAPILAPNVDLPPPIPVVAPIAQTTSGSARPMSAAKSSAKSAKSDSKPALDPLAFLDSLDSPSKASEEQVKSTNSPYAAKPAAVEKQADNSVAKPIPSAKPATSAKRAAPAAASKASSASLVDVKPAQASESVKKSKAVEKSDALSFLDDLVAEQSKSSGSPRSTVPTVTARRTVHPDSKSPVMPASQSKPAIAGKAKSEDEGKSAAASEKPTTNVGAAPAKTSNNSTKEKPTPGELSKEDEEVDESSGYRALMPRFKRSRP